MRMPKWIIETVLYTPKGGHKERPTNLPPPPLTLILCLTEHIRVCEESPIHSYSKLTVGRIHKASVLWRQSEYTLEWTELRVNQIPAETRSCLWGRNEMRINNMADALILTTVPLFTKSRAINMIVWDSECRVASNICCSCDPSTWQRVTLMPCLHWCGYI